MESFDLVKTFIETASDPLNSLEKSLVSPAPLPPTLVLNPHPRYASPSSTSSTDQLLSIYMDNNLATRKPICIESKATRKKDMSSATNVLQVHLQTGASMNANLRIIGGKCGNGIPGKQKIPRPANAFMLFANEWRKKLALENPRESNKDISVRLGVLWKNMAKDIKQKYFVLAKEVDAEHKRKYPDYVYNPKEARLRKAMREQSRELSRQSILQTAIASANGTGSAAGTGVGGATSASFLNHQLSCASSAAAAASSLPGSPSANQNRIINPWFPIGHPAPPTHLKPILSPRVMAAHQRTLEKTKEAIRKQVECAAAGAFSAGSGAGYAGDFAAHSAAAGPAGANEYCIIAEFADTQKWHPYQSGANPYHGRGAAMSKLGGLHPNVQNTNMHGHGPWAQFCGLPLSASAAQNSMIRASRHMVFLQDQQNQHCSFNDEMQLPYAPNKMEINHRLHSAYPQAEAQVKTSVSPPQLQHLQDDDKCVLSNPRWDSGPPASHNQMTNLPSTKTARLPEPLQEQDQLPEPQEAPERDETMQRTSCKQPLPGFHQAFGSTEIGRFSRSEFFANMVGDSGNNPLPEAYLSGPVFPFSPSSQSLLGIPTMPPAGAADEDLLQQIMPEDCYWLGGLSHPSAGIDAATNYAAFLDYSHRLSQEWLHPAAATHQDLQQAFVEQPACLFLENNCSLLGSHDHPTYSSASSSRSSCTGYPCPTLEHNRENQENLNVSEEPVVVKQNDRICVMLESNEVKMEKDAK